MAQGRDEMNTDGREANAATPLGGAPGTDSGEGGAERYPAVRQDDAVERTGRTEQVTGESAEPRSFDPAADAPNPPQGAGDTSAPVATNEGRLGPEADPVEGKR